MRAVVFHEHGGPEVRRLEERWPRPEPRKGETLVEVKAVALNHLDIFVRRGMPGVHLELPHISGGDAAGVVAGTGERVLVDPMVPEGAIGENTQGALAEYAAVPEQNLIPLPENVSFEQAAALPIAYGTAWKLLVDRGELAAGESVLIVGASGGVGTAAVQIAKLAGATVYAASSSAEKLERLLELGADHAVDTSSDDWGKDLWTKTGKRGVDVVVDYSGQATWPTSIRSLTHGGRLLTCGATSGYEAVTDLRYVWTREQTIMGSDGWTREGLVRLLELVQTGRITPVIDRVLPLERTREAEEALERREVFGKVILQP
jgi:alcohol dehydrogenase